MNMSKEELIARILEIKPNALRGVLEGIDVDNLREYLRHLQDLQAAYVEFSL